MYIDNPWNPKILAFVDKWSLFGYLWCNKSLKWDLNMVFVIDRSLLYGGLTLICKMMWSQLNRIKYISMQRSNFVNPELVLAFTAWDRVAFWLKNYRIHLSNYFVITMSIRWFYLMILTIQMLKESHPSIILSYRSLSRRKGQHLRRGWILREILLFVFHIRRTLLNRHECKAELR